jgi:hypothetical protein
MRLAFALSAAASVALLGWAVPASAEPASSPPSAAPIFYCPTPAPATATACPVKTAPAGHVSHRPALREAREHHHAHGVHEHQYAAAGGDVAQAQALIYRYERAVGGLNARAVREAWHVGGEGPPPPDAAMAPPPPPDMAPPPPVGGMLVLRVPPANGHVDAHDGGPPPDEYRSSDRVYAWDDAEAGGRVSTFGFQGRDSDSHGVWVFVDRDGERHYQHLGEAHIAPPPCPPPHDVGCTAGESFQSGDGQWRDGSYGAVYQYAGRDAQGYLVWPGKTPQQP